MKKTQKSQQISVWRNLLPCYNFILINHQLRSDQFLDHWNKAYESNDLRSMQVLVQILCGKKQKEWLLNIQEKQYVTIKLDMILYNCLSMAYDLKIRNKLLDCAFKQVFIFFINKINDKKYLYQCLQYFRNIIDSLIKLTKFSQSDINVQENFTVQYLLEFIGFIQGFQKPWNPNRKQMIKAGLQDLIRLYSRQKLIKRLLELFLACELKVRQYLIYHQFAKKFRSQHSHNQITNKQVLLTNPQDQFVFLKLKAQNCKNDVLFVSYIGVFLQQINYALISQVYTDNKKIMEQIYPFLINLIHQRQNNKNKKESQTVFIRFFIKSTVLNDLQAALVTFVRKDITLLKTKPEQIAKLFSDVQLIKDQIKYYIENNLEFFQYNKKDNQSQFHQKPQQKIQMKKNLYDQQTIASIPQHQQIPKPIDYLLFCTFFEQFNHNYQVYSFFKEYPKYSQKAIDNFYIYKNQQYEIKDWLNPIPNIQKIDSYLIKKFPNYPVASNKKLSTNLLTEQKKKKIS